MSLAEALHDLHGANDLKLAAVVSADGLVVEAASSHDVDAESICSVAANGLLIMDAMSQELDEDQAQLVTFEYPGHVLMMSPLDSEHILVLLAGAGTNLGRLRIVLRRHSQRLSEALSSV